MFHYFFKIFVNKKGLCVPSVRRSLRQAQARDHTSTSAIAPLAPSQRRQRSASLEVTTSSFHAWILSDYTDRRFRLAQFLRKLIGLHLLLDRIHLSYVLHKGLPLIPYKSPLQGSLKLHWIYQFCLPCPVLLRMWSSSQSELLIHTNMVIGLIRYNLGVMGIMQNLTCFVDPQCKF